MELLKETKMKALLNKILNYWEIILAGIFILVGVIVLSGTFAPLAKEEVRYQFSSKGKDVVVAGKAELEKISSVQKAGLNVIEPIDEDFGIIIPKISANAKVIADVDSNDSAVYQRALTKGVAHARGSAYPGEGGNVFIFAHSGLNFPEAIRYNAVFYLLGNLNVGDDIFLFRDGEKFQYAVKEKKIVEPSDVQYSEKEKVDEVVTLMTCWPAGTTLRRLVIIGQRI
jgi:sortase A